MKIIWDRWIDPYTTEDLKKLNLADVTEEEELNNFEQDGFIAELEELLDEPVINHHPIKTIMTPLGVIPIYEHSLPSKIFKFWVGHTDFDITKGLVEVMKEIPGVETLDIHTRYRFKVGVGRAFRSKEVLKNIQDTIFAEMNKGNIIDKYVERMSNGYV
jgi:hypothetical protein